MKLMAYEGQNRIEV